MQFGGIFSFRSRTHDDTEILRLDGFDDLLKSFSFLGRVDFAGHGNDIVEWRDDYKSVREGKSRN